MVSFGIHPRVPADVVFLDGIAGSGKILLNSVLPSLDAVEHTQVLTLLEQIIPATALGGISLECAKALVRVRLNETIYNTALGRHTNFRYRDYTGVHNFREPRIYYERLAMPDGDEVVAKLGRERHILLLQTHDLLVNLSIVDQLEIDYKMLALFRHPVDNLFSWLKRNWGERFGTDPRAFTLTIARGGAQLPWYCAAYEEEWLALKPAERCVRTVCDLIARSVQQYRERSAAERILLFTFEDVIRDPDAELERICAFLHTKRTPYTDAFVARDVYSDGLTPGVRETRVAELRLQIGAGLFDQLMATVAAYERDVYGLR